MMGTDQMRINTRTALLLIVFLTAGVYAKSLFGEFVCDDWLQIVNNEQLSSVKYIPGYFTHGVWHHTKMEMVDYYRPLFLLVQSFNYQVWGENPFGFHLMNLMLHIGNGALVFLLLKKILRKEGFVPFMGALIFALHPVNAESVSWISALTELLAAFFLLSSFFVYLKHKEKGKNIFLALSVVFFALSLFSKEAGIMFPAVIGAYDYIKEKKIYIRRLALFGAAAALYFFCMSLALEKTGTAGIIKPSFPGAIRLIEFTAGYIRLLFFPWPPGFYLTVPDEGIAGASGIVFSGIVLIVTVLYSVKDRIFLFAFSWMVVTIALPLSLAFSSVPHYALRYLYMPSAGFVLMIAGVMGRLKPSRRMPAAFFCLLVIIFGLLTFRATLNWQDDKAFYSMAIKTTPKYKGGYLGLSNYYERKGRFEEAINAVISVIPLIPDKEKPLAYERIALLYAQKEDPQQSIFYYRKALELNPGNTDALNGIGNNYFKEKKYSEALKYYKEAFSLDMKNIEVCYNLALSYEALGDDRMAVRYYNLFLDNAPEDGYAEIKRGVREILKSRYKEN